jgi:hypothetical protein
MHGGKFEEVAVAPEMNYQRHMSHELLARVVQECFAKDPPLELKVKLSKARAIPSPTTVFKRRGAAHSSAEGRTLLPDRNQ